MSSLLQFSGKMDRRKGVRLEFVLERWVDKPMYDCEHGKKTDKVLYTYRSKERFGPSIPCTICGRNHSQIYVAWRKPAGTWGHWVVFRYLGEEHVPDLSIPIGVERLPKGAKALSPEENSHSWHS